VEVPKVEPKTIKQPKLDITTAELNKAIKTSLNNTTFKRGVTYKELAKKYNVKESYIFKINKGHIK
jgi:ribosome-binding protein aMBF1 (putative translation factor)